MSFLRVYVNRVLQALESVVNEEEVMSTFSSRRQQMFNIISTLAEENSSVATLNEVVFNQGYKRSEIKEDVLCAPDTINIYYFLRSIALSEEGNQPSYWNFKKFPDCGSYYAESDYRVRCRWSVFLKHLVRWGFLPEDYPVERTAEWLGNNWPKDGDYEFKEENSAYDAYQKAEFGSCMYGKDYTEWYDENSDVVKVIGIYQGRRFVGRALRWKATDEEGNTITYLDRVYPSDGGAHTRAIRKWATEQGWVCKESDNMDDEELELTVEMDYPTNNEYPYMDTFKYAHVVDDKIVLATSYKHKINGYRYEAILNSTSGSGPSSGPVCNCCDERVSSVSSVLIGNGDYESWCEDCVSSDAIYIETGRFAYGYARSHVTVELHDGTYATDFDATGECEVCECVFMYDDLSSTSLSDRLVCEDHLITLPNGDTCAYDELEEYLIVDDNGTYRYIQDMMEDVDLNGGDVELANKLFNEIQAGQSFSSAVFNYRFNLYYGDLFKVLTEQGNNSEERVA